MKLLLMRIAAAFLCAVSLVLSFSGCGAKIEPIVSTENAPAETETAEKPKTEPDTCEELRLIPTGVKGQIPLKIISFNVNTYNPNAQGSMHWQNRKDALCAYILSLDADVICTQETPEIYRDYFAEKLGAVYGWEHFSHNMTLYRKDRFEKLDFIPRYYGADPTKKAPAYDASMERNFTMTHLRDKTSGAEFYAVNTHLDNKGLKARIFAAKQLLEILSKIEIPYLLCGDFNSNETSYAYKDLTNLLLDCAKIAAVSEGGSTFNKWGERMDETLLPIDFIFVCPVNITVQSYKVLRDRWGDGYLYSDHYPVCTELRLSY